MRSIGNRILGGALAAWLLALVGCGAAPTAPQLDGSGKPGGGAPRSSTRSGGASHEGLIGDLLEPMLDAGGRAAVIPDDPRPVPGGGLELSKPVVGATGSEFKVGDVTVKVPPDAFEGDAEIKVTVPDAARLECRLEIFPPSKNHFEVPVRLEFDVRAAANPRFMVVYWLDEYTREWVPLTTTVDLATGKASAELPHFSIYKAECEVRGRAGW